MDVENWGKEVRVVVCAFASECGKVSAGQANERVFGKGTCSLSDAEGKAEVFAFVSMGADTKANAFGRQAHSSEVSAAAACSARLLQAH